MQNFVSGKRKDNLIRQYYRKLIPLFIHKAIRKTWKFKPWRLVFLPLFPAIVAIGALRRLKKKSSHISRILVINLAAIGDNLMSTPAIRALNVQFPKAAITVMTASRQVLDAYINNPRVKRVFWLKQFDAGGVKDAFRNKSRKLSDLFKVFTCYPIVTIKLLIANYDIGINFCAFKGGDNFGSLLMYLCGIPRRLGSFGEYTELLTDKKNPQTLKEKHWVDIYLGIIETFGEEEAAKDLEFYISEKDREFAEKFFGMKNISKDDVLVGIHPGGKTHVNNKRWPVERFAEVINRLSEKHVFKLVLFGAENEEALVNRLKSLVKLDSISIVGFPFGRAAALLQRVNIFLINDSGLLHLADAVRCPCVVSLFGPTDPRRIVPRNERNIYISSKIECAPCIELDAGDESKRCTKEDRNECLKQISKEEVLNILESVFRQ